MAAYFFSPVCLLLPTLAGVEMEALVGCSTAALCVYDMLKASSHDIVISNLRLEAKSGGKRHFEREAAEAEAVHGAAGECAG